MRTQKIIFYLLLLVFPLGQLCRVAIPSLSAVVFHPIDLFCGLFVFFWLARKKKTKNKKIKPPLFFPQMFIFILVAVFSLIYNFPKYGFGLSAFFYLLRLLNYFLFYWAARDFFTANPLNLKKTFFFEGVLISIVALCQYLFIPDTRFLFSLGWDMHYFRAIGSFLDPAFTGIICTLSFLTLIDLFFNEAVKDKRTKYLFFTGGLLILLCIAFSFSRISYLCLMIGLAVYFWLKNKKKLLGGFFLLFLFIVFLLPKPGGEGVDLLRKSSFVMRVENYQSIFTIINDHLFFGVGYNNLRLVKFNYGFLNEISQFASHSGAGADNSLLFVLATTGLLGFISYLYLLIIIFKKVFLNIDKDYALLLLVTLVCIILSSLVVNSLFYPWILFWLMLVLARFTVEEEK